MKSLKELLIKGPGPSSSHTIGPYRICLDFLSKLDKSKVYISYKVTLYGSLGLTGKGHFTNKVIKDVFKDKDIEIVFNPSFEGLVHPNTMELIAYDSFHKQFKLRYISIGGGSFCLENQSLQINDCYPFNSFEELKKIMMDDKIEDIYKLIEKYDEKDIFNYGKELIEFSFQTIEDEINSESVILPPFGLNTVANKIYKQANTIKNIEEKRSMLLTSFAYAVAEANSQGKQIVTTPTCGASGVVPSLLYYEHKYKNKSIDEIIKAFLVGGLICNFIKTNASVSGALLGCQAEIGSASCFASASLAYLNKLGVYQIEYASEVAMEHFLGLTCDPVGGYVQIPCIERNGIAAIHAYSSYLFAKNISLYRTNKISFDNVIKAMKETGMKMDVALKETSLGGLAKLFTNKC